MELNNGIKSFWNKATIAERFIAVNVVLFLLVRIIPFLFSFSTNALLYYVELSQEIGLLLFKPWSILTYAFFHIDFSHLFWNMLLLWGISNMFLNLFDQRYYLRVYVLGTLFGALFYLVSYQLFPAFTGSNSALIGASAAVMSLVIFLATYSPDYIVRIFTFKIKLWYIGLFLVLVDLIQLPNGNAGGHIAHLGGAYLGYLYATKLKSSKDVGAGFFKFLERLFTKSSPLKTVHRSNKQTKNKSKGDVLSNDERQKKIDAILDKISNSGYESLSKAEKDFLFRAGKK